jgi:hypothetical protein
MTMVEILATKTSLPGRGTPGAFEAVRAEALFASALQPSGSASADQVRRAVATTLRRLGFNGCAAQMASEFGDHPDVAMARMRWALATIRTVYPTPSMTPTPDLRPLALAS